MKNFYDLEVLSRTFTFEGKTVAQAIQNTFQNRGTDLPVAGLPVAFTAEFYDDVNKKRQWTAFCVKNKSYVEKTEFKAVMEAIRTFLVLPVRTVKEGHPFTKTWKPGGRLGLKGYQCTSFEEFSRLGTMRITGFSLLFSPSLCGALLRPTFRKMY